MTRRHPFQKICITPDGDEHHQLLLAASGPTINCIDSKAGKLLYQWPSQHDDSGDDDDDDQENGGRPNKRRKLDSNGHTLLSRQQSEASDASIEIVAERKKGERKKSKIIDTKLPNVSHLLATSEGKHIIAVTSEDKAIRVFELSSTGKLRMLSQRSMAKKLCALRLTRDEKTILIADKFGDVYAVPLHESEVWIPKQRTQTKSAFRPSATELTVHTRGNLAALRQQQEQKKANQKKEGLEFEHQLLLGHVSLLTDLAVAEGIVNGRPRPFILTADRDEHIRVSRGMPQAHVIENFCLGHRDFVTKLCIPPLKPEMLIAGNGEPSLRIYDWQTGQLMQTLIVELPVPISLTEDTTKGPQRRMELPEGRIHGNLAISGIWPVNFSKTTNPHGIDESIVLVAIEGMPFLLTYIVHSEGLIESGSIELQGNVLDVVMLNSTRQILVSIDTVHKPCSMKLYREETEPQDSPFQVLELQTNEKQVIIDGKFLWEIVDLPFDCSEITQALPQAPQPLVEDNTKNKSYEKTFGPLGDLLYGLENLRKKRGATAEEEAVEEAAIEAEEGDTAIQEELTEV